VQTGRNYLSRGPSYSQFCLKIRYHGNRGRQAPGPENKGVSENSAQLFFTGAELYSIFVPKFAAWQQRSSGEKFK